MKYAVIVAGGIQHKAEEGKNILVNRLSLKKEEKVVFDKVIIYRDQDEILIGSPYLSQVQVTGKMLEEVKGEKTYVYKYKAKAHYRRKTGYRPKYSMVLIEKINRLEKSKVNVNKTV